MTKKQVCGELLVHDSQPLLCRAFPDSGARGWHGLHRRCVKVLSVLHYSVQCRIDFYQNYSEEITLVRALDHNAILLQAWNDAGSLYPAPRTSLSHFLWRLSSSLRCSLVSCPK